MPDAVQSAESAGTSERRLHPRKPLWFPRIQLGDQNGGIILNISERGLAMLVVRSLADDLLRQMRFQLSDTSAWVETQGRIAWSAVRRRRQAWNLWISLMRSTFELRSGFHRSNRAHR
jgi:hypothetical protein